jgi:hypothetical protein
MTRKVRICEFELDSAVVPYLVNREALRAAKKVYGPELDAEIHRPEGDMILRYRGTGTDIRQIIAEYGIRTRAQEFNNEHLV